MLFMAGCSAGNTGSQKTGYQHISQEEAKEMMEKDDNHIIVDVRRQDEYDVGHIPEAVCIPNESIGTEQPSELPDLNQIILVYCRSGNRSRQASEKLADIGYTNVYEFGGINEWTGDIVTEEQIDLTVWHYEEMPAEVRYDRMWEYSDSAVTSDPDMIQRIVEAVKEVKPGSKTDTATEDYTDLLTFTFADGTEYRLEFENQTWVNEAGERYETEGLSSLREVLDEMIETKETVMRMLIGETEVPVTWEDNASVEELKGMLPVTVQMSMYGGFEQVGPLGKSIARNDVQTTTEAGDIVLYSGNQIVVFYGSNSWAYTRLGHVDLSRQEMTDLLGYGDVTITFTE